MLAKFAVCLLLASSAVHGSAIKGGSLARDEAPVKGRLEAPIKGRLGQEQHLEQLQQAPIQAEQKLEFSQQRLEETSQREEVKSRYEARPQVRLEEYAAPAPPASKPTEQRTEQLELSKTRAEQKPEAELKYETQRAETHYEAALGQQQVEVREEQRNYEAQEQYNYEQELRRDYSQQQQQQQQELTQEPIVQERAAAIKGGPLSAPPGQAEPYAFDYKVEGSSRRESSDANGVVRGQYTLQGADGASRVVEYVADKNGFRAQVSTNEFGTDNKAPANVDLRSSQPAAEDISLRLEGKTREFLKPAPVVQAPPVPARPENWDYKGQEPASQQQIEQGPLYEPAPLAVKAPAPAPAKGQRELEARPLLLQPIKGTRTEETKEQLQQAELSVERREQQPSAIKSAEQREQQQQPLASAAKSAELRAPAKAPVAEYRSQQPVNVVKLRSGFESATAHRPIVHTRQQAHHHHQAPIVRQHLPVVHHQRAHHQVVAPVHHPQLAAPSPVAYHHHHHQIQRQPVPAIPVASRPIAYSYDQRPRAGVSFYSPLSAHDDDQLASIGFERS